MRDVPWGDIFKLGASAAASEFCEWAQVGSDAYIPHRKYQVKPHSSPWFSAACAAATVHRNHFFCLYQREKSSDSKVKFRWASNCCKRVLEAAKLAYANKTKEPITSQKLGSHDFWRIANSVLNKGKSAILPLFIGPEVLSSVSDKAKLFAENFSINSNLDHSGISLPVFPFRTNLKLHNISGTPKMVRKVIINLDLSKASRPDFFFFNWDSLHARLNSHYKAWSYNKTGTKKVTGYRKSALSVYSGLKGTNIVGQRKAFYRQRIPEISCARKETVDMHILVISSNGDRKTMQSIRITSRPPLRKRK